MNRWACVLRLGAAWCLTAGVAVSGFAAVYRVRVATGEIARDESPVRFRLPAAGARWRLLDPSGRAVALQVEPDGEATFILPHLDAGGRVDYRLETVSAPLAEGRDAIVMDRSDGLITARAGGQTVFVFHEEKSPLPDPKLDPVFRRAGYIHPLFSPSGLLETDDYPQDHFHHHGIWFAWVHTDFQGRHPDFWNVGDGTGRVDLLGVDRVWSGPVEGGFIARLQSVDVSAPKPVAAVNETWEVRLYAVGQGTRRYWMFDLISTQRCAGDSPLGLPTYRYGGLGIRGNAQWDGQGDPVKFFPSNGITDRIKAHETRAEWCHMGGLVDGKFTGIATLAHPDNFRAPEPMRVNPKHPFLNFAPSQAGYWTMLPGQTYVWRYRFIVADGEPDREWLDARWRDYASPVSVMIEPLDS